MRRMYTGPNPSRSMQNGTTQQSASKLRKSYFFPLLMCSVLRALFHAFSIWMVLIAVGLPTLHNSAALRYGLRRGYNYV